MESTENVRIRAREADRDVSREDVLAVEEPLLLRIRKAPDGPLSPFVTTMRTPGNDEELAAGLLFAEGVLESSRDLVALDRPSDPRLGSELASNALVASLTTAAFERAGRLQRATVMGSACGVCGKTSIDRVVPNDRPPLSSSVKLTPEFLYSLPGRLRERQSIFARTGGLHAAALFSEDGELRSLREDIGRHNATDKVVGSFLLKNEWPLSNGILTVSGRAGFEIVQKAYSAGIPFVASVSAPSSLAVSLAEAGGITLIGFLRERRFNIYTHPYRVA